MEEKETIGILGASPGAGVTHLTILLANYMTGVRRKRTAVLEWNRHGDFDRFGEACLGKRPRARPWRILGSDYFGEADGDMLVQCMNGPYETVLFDCGRAEEGGGADFVRCGRKLVVGSFSEWQAESFLGILRERKRAGDGWQYLAAFGGEESRKIAERSLKLPILRIPWLPDPWCATKETIDLFGRLLEQA